MSRALENFEGTISVGGRQISNLRFADDIDLLACSMQELSEITERLDKTSSAFGMEISAEKSKILTTSGTYDDQNITIQVNNTNLKRVKESCITEDATSLREVKTHLAIATQNLAKLKKIWKSNTISIKMKIKLLCAVVLSTALYRCEAWTITQNLEKRINAFEMRCFRHLIQIPYTAHRTNDSIRNEIKILIGDKYEPLGETLKHGKLKWFGHAARHYNTLSHTILKGMVEGVCPRGRPKTNWTKT